VVLSLQTLPPSADTESDRRCGTEWGWLARLGGSAWALGTHQGVGVEGGGEGGGEGGRGGTHHLQHHYVIRYVSPNMATSIVQLSVGELQSLVPSVPHCSSLIP